MAFLCRSTIRQTKTLIALRQVRQVSTDPVGTFDYGPVGHGQGLYIHNTDTPNFVSTGISKYKQRTQFS